MEQLLVLIMRCWKTRRLEAMGAMRLANFSFTGIIVGLLWWQVGQSNTLTRAADTTAMLFFMIVRSVCRNPSLHPLWFLSGKCLFRFGVGFALQCCGRTEQPCM